MSDYAEIIVGRRLKTRRRLLGLTQRELGTACGLAFQQIQKYECGANRVAATTLWRIACALDVDIGYFFAGLVPEAPAPNAARTFESVDAKISIAALT